MKKNPSRPSREEIREQRRSIAALDFYRKMKRVRDVPPVPMSSTQAGLLDLAKNLKALPDVAEAVYAAHFRRVQEECREAVARGQYDPLWRNLALFGPRLLVESGEVTAIVEEWWYAAKQGDQDAKKNLKAVLDALSVKQGKYQTLTEEERETIIADCKKWRPVCEQLNEVFKQLWEQAEYHSSELYRKEARGGLAEKLGIPVADVEAVEWSLKQRAKRSNKTTPWDAMLHIVARKHIPQSDPTKIRGVKTVETIYMDYLKARPQPKDEETKNRYQPS